jgi:hypothetical protein
LKKALVELQEAVHDLCDPREGVMLRDDLTTTEHTAPSLLDQIAALGHGGRSEKSGGSGSRLPLDPAKLDAWLEIKASAMDLHDRAVMHSELTPEQCVRHVAELAQRWSDPQAVLWARDRVRQWSRMILTVLDPPKRVHIAAACPQCDVRMVWRDDPSLGEEVQAPALSLDSETGCTCLACGAHWPPEQFEHLALVLGCEPVKEAS